MQRIVLENTVTRDEVDEARVACRLRLANIVTARAGIPAQLMMLSFDRRDLVHYVEDAQLDVRYLVINGPGEVDTRGVLEGALRTVTQASLTKMFADGEVRALAVAALMGTQMNAPSERAEALIAFDRALVDRDPKVRTFALVAAAYARWPELRPRLERVARADPNDSLRVRAEEILEAWPPP